MHRVTIDRSAAVPVVVARGELDAYAEPDVLSAFVDVREDLRVVVDLEAVSFLDSTALGAFVRALQQLNDRGGEALVVLPATAARRIFEITTLDRALPTSESRALAIEKLTPPGL
jgi:anti-sigma B factor antagonist